MKNNNYFLAFPFSAFCEKNKDILSNNAKDFFEKLTNLFKNNNLNYYSAHERESWGEKYNSDVESTKFDYEAIKKSNVVICAPGNPYSGGTHIELGWASVLKKRIILLLEKDVYYSPLVTGISYMTNTEIYYYKDFFIDVIPIIEMIVKNEIKKKYTNIINNFLKTKNEKLIKCEEAHGGNNNTLFIVNDKYFVKFKDELSVKEERMYFKKEKKYSPILYYSNIKNKLLIYEFLKAHDLEDVRSINNIIDIVYDYSKNDSITSRKGYGYFGIENSSWIDFLKQEVNVSKEYLSKFIDKKDYITVDKALNNIKNYKFKKRILHGDFGIHNTMISEDNKIYFIDPEPVLGDWIYDFIFYCFSDVSLLKMISFDEIIKRIDEDECKVKSMMIIVMFNRLRRVMKYSKEDFNDYYDCWKKLGGLFND